MNVLSLFSGIGGLDLGLERAGMAVVGQVEIDPYCRAVLARHCRGACRMTCSCGPTARHRLPAAGVDVDAHPTPPLTGPAPAVIGTCEHGVAWPATGPKPYYESDGVCLYHGDCREVLPALGGTYDAALVDPPYGETSLAWDRWPDGWLEAVGQAADSLWCFGSLRLFLERYAEFHAAGWKLSQDVVWRKQNGSSLAADRFRRVHEIVTHWYRGPWASVHHETPRRWSGVKEKGRVVRQGQPGHLGRIDPGTWTDDGTRLVESVLDVRSMWRRGQHPTQKPVEILTPLLEYAVPVGGVVLDPMAGVGSTGVAALLTGRRAVLIEAEERYCELAARRLDQGVLDLGASTPYYQPDPDEPLPAAHLHGGHL